MKKCPQCPRTYDDDSLVFCLEDGARLSVADEPPPTEILPTPWTHSNDPQQTIKAFVPLGYAQSGTTNELHEKKASNVWIIVTGGLLVVVLGGGLTGLGYLAWKANEKSNDTPQVSSTHVPLVSNPPANTNPSPGPTAKPSESEASWDWLNGTWTGEGYQTDTKTTWQVILTVKDGSYKINYPNIPCRGRWRLNDKNSQGASFTELITQGLDRCTNNGHVKVDKINDTEISCKFFPAGSRTVNATAVLTKKP